MKKQHIILGLFVSFGLSCITAFPHIIRLGKMSIDIWFVTKHISFNLLVAFSCWLAQTFLLHRQQRSSILTGILAIGAGILLFFLYDYLLQGVVNVVIQSDEITLWQRNLIILFRGLLSSGFTYFILYYLYLLEEKQRHVLEIAELKQAQLEANISSLKEQLSPHFLFNTLNTLSIIAKDKEVKNYVFELSNVYRYVLKYKENNVATIEQEIDFIRSYFYIIKARFQEAIQIDISIHKDLLQSKILPFSLQLLVENAIKHNIASSQKRLYINIYNEENQYLVIENNLQPKNSLHTSVGIGLDNIMKRYNFFFKKDINIIKNSEKFTVKLPII